MRAARDAYRKAARLGSDKYHVLNDVQLSHLLGETGLDPATQRIDEAFAPSSSDVHAESEFTGYWDRVADADRLLTGRLLTGDLAGAAKELRGAYEEVFGERSTWRQRDSTVDHLWDLSQLHADVQEADALAELWRALQEAWQGDRRAPPLLLSPVAHRGTAVPGGTDRHQRPGA